MLKKFWNWLKSLFTKKPTPPPVEPPPVEPPPLPGPGCFPPPDGPGWTPVAASTAELTDVIRAFQQITALGATPEESLENLAKNLRAADWCAGRMNDAVFIMRKDALWEEHHAIYYGNNSWLSNPFRGVWKYESV